MPSCETFRRSFDRRSALLADQTAKVLAGISDALNGLALLVGAPVRSVPRRRGFQIRVPDWLPSLVNAGRAFVTIGIVEIFWIMTEWPNGAFAILFAAITVLLLAPQADRAYAAAMRFMIGNVLGTVFTAIIAFAVLPGLETFEAFSLAAGWHPAVQCRGARERTSNEISIGELREPVTKTACRVTYEELAKRLKDHGLPEETRDSIKSKLKRGTFAATWFLACLAALELDGVRLGDI